VLVRLKEAVAKARTRRMNLWQIDPNRKTLRLRFEVRAPLCAQHPAGMVATLARALMAAGVPVAMGLGKTPRPAVHLGHPLPLQVEGGSEWADATLQEGPGLNMEALADQINASGPPGLKILQCALVSNHASPVSDLCCRAHWRWACPEPLRERARAAMAGFEAAECFEWERPGKAKRIDIRPLLKEIHWEGDALAFQTRLAQGEATNPQKLLAAILGLAPEAIQGLTRLRVELRDDPRVLQAHKFEPKLHNMFEDAVLLEAGSNIRIVDEDDDEPLLLG
jgi:radical SAM-linked protein